MASLVQVAALSADWYEPAHEAHAKGSPRSIPQRCRSAVAHSESVLMLLCLLLLVVSAAAAPTTSAACTASARATISRALAQVQAGSWPQPWPHFHSGSILYHIKIGCKVRAQQNRATARPRYHCASPMDLGTRAVRCPDRFYT
jgi:hypothetical protein